MDTPGKDMRAQASAYVVSGQPYFAGIPLHSVMWMGGRDRPGGTPPPASAAYVASRVITKRRRANAALGVWLLAKVLAYHVPLTDSGCRGGVAGVDAHVPDRRAPRQNERPTSEAGSVSFGPSSHSRGQVPTGLD